MAYEGTVDLIDGVRPKNNGQFPLMNAKDVYVDDNTRLDAALQSKAAAVIVNGQTVDTKTYIDSHIAAVYLQPEDYGAIGDGSTNDAVAIQACINAAQTMGTQVSVRGYGNYRIDSTIEIHGDNLNIYLNSLDYYGSSGSAIKISAANSKIQFGAILGTHSSADTAGIKIMPQNTVSSASDGFTNNELSCDYIYTKGNCIEITDNINEATDALEHNIFNLPYLYSTNGNCIYINSNSANELDFYGKTLLATNGYALYSMTSTNANYRVIPRLHNFCFDENLKNGIYGNAILINCSAEKLINKQTTNNNSGKLFVFNGVVPCSSTDEESDSISLTSIDATNALSFDDLLNTVKTAFEANPSADDWETWNILGCGQRRTWAEFNTCTKTANANLASDNKLHDIPTGKIIVYYNNIAFKPNQEIYKRVDSDLTIALSSTDNYDYITPTVFDANASLVNIHLDASYCAIAINEFDVIQYSDKKVKVYDRNNTLIFDGTNKIGGTYHFKCSLTPLETLSVTLTGGTTKSAPKAWVKQLYTGSNEGWTIAEPSDTTSDITTAIVNAQNATTTANNSAIVASAAATRIENLAPSVSVEQIEGEHYQIVIQNTHPVIGTTRARKVIFVSDSYGQGFALGEKNLTQPWNWRIAQNLAGEDIAFYHACHGSFSFGTSDQSLRFENIFNSNIGVSQYDENGCLILDSGGAPVYQPFSLPTGVSDNDITDIYVFAGRNDFNNSSSDILLGIQAFIAKCKLKFPNAHVNIGMIGGISRNGYANSGSGQVYNSSVDYEVKRLNTIETYSLCSRYGATYIPNCDAILRDTQYISLDGIHPNSFGQDLLSMYLANAVMGREIGVNRLRPYVATFIDSTVNYNSGWTLYGSGSFSVIETQHNQNVTVTTLVPLTLIHNTTANLELNTRIKLFRPSDTCSVGDALIHGSMTAEVIFYEENGTVHTSRNTVELIDGWIQLYIEGMKMDGTYETSPLPNIKRIYLPSITLNI